MPFAQQLNLIAYGRLDEAAVAAVARRLAELDTRLDEAEREALTRLAGGVAPAAIAAAMRSAVDPDRQRREACRINELDETASPSPAQLAEAREYLLLAATAPLASSPDLRVRLAEIDRRDS